MFMKMHYFRTVARQFSLEFLHAEKRQVNKGCVSTMKLSFHQFDARFFAVRALAAD